MTIDLARPAQRNQMLPAPPRRGVLLTVSALSLVVVLGAAVGLVADARLITGVPAWIKPLKFAVSIAVYCVTLAWLLTLVQGRRRLVRTVAWVSGLALALELVLILTQVVRGTTSHFNAATPFDRAVFGAMGGLVALVFLAAAGTAVLLTRQRGLAPVLASGIRGGLLVSLLGMAEAGLMIANRSGGAAGGHTVGSPDGGPGLPLTGWSTEHGDLRVSHFVGLHALQLLPLLAWLLQRYVSRLGVVTGVRLVRLATVACAGTVVLLAWQAERGLPLLRPDAAVLAAAVLGGGLVAAAAATVLRGRRA